MSEVNHNLSPHHSDAVVRVDEEGELNRVAIRFVGATLATYTAASA